MKEQQKITTKLKYKKKETKRKHFMEIDKLKFYIYIFVSFCLQTTTLKTHC